jgi:hypothetical protein
MRSGHVREAENLTDTLIARKARYTGAVVKTRDNIFAGNDHHKDFINEVARQRPQENLAVVTRIGGDEYGISVWDAKAQELLIFRLDGNNIGAISGAHGRQAGDEIIDRQLLVSNRVAQEAIHQTEMGIAKYIQYHLPRAMDEEFKNSGYATPVKYAIAGPEVVVRVPAQPQRGAEPAGGQPSAPQLHLVDRTTGELYTVTLINKMMPRGLLAEIIPEISDSKGNKVTAWQAGIKVNRLDEYEVRVTADKGNILSISPAEYEALRGQKKVDLETLTGRVEVLPSVTAGFVRIPLEKVSPEIIANRDIAYGQ